MTQTDKPPSFAKYTILNAPRYQPKGSELTRGGGLMIGIHKSVDYREIKDAKIRDKGDGVTEWQMVEFPLGGDKKWRITNIYIYHQREEGSVETRVANQ